MPTLLVHSSSSPRPPKEIVNPLKRAWSKAASGGGGQEVERKMKEDEGDIEGDVIVVKKNKKGKGETISETISETTSNITTHLTLTIEQRLSMLESFILLQNKRIEWLESQHGVKVRVNVE